MLKNLDPLLSPDLLHVLGSLGHGDVLALVDANFPADSVARNTVSGRLVRIDGVEMARVARAICSIMPLDTFIDEPVRQMQPEDEPEEIPAIQAEVHDALEQAEGRDVRMGSLARFAFYDAAKEAYAVVATTDNRPWGCFLLTKGVIF